VTITAALARCTEAGCPWRFRSGRDRACPDHDADDRALRAAAESLGIDLGALAQTAPGDRGKLDGAH
jgi:hypothetical protein